MNDVMMDSAEQADEDSGIYEVGYLLMSTLSTEEMPAVFTSIKDLILSLGAEIISHEMPTLIPLAYTMVKVTPSTRIKANNGYFGWVKFLMSKNKIDELKKHLDLDANVLRFLIIKTVRENTMAVKRFTFKGTYRRTPAPKNSDGTPVSLDKEKVDQEIEAMVAV